MKGSADNRRKYERFDVSLQAKLALVEQQHSFDLSTRDISAGGAFFDTEKPVTEGCKVTIEITISNETLKKMTGYGSCIKVDGVVVRSDSDGIAVSFKGHEIVPVKYVHDN